MITAVEEDDRHYLVMEYVEGGSLLEVLDEDESLPLERVLAQRGFLKAYNLFMTV